MGRNATGELGNGTNTNISSPLQIGFADTWVNIAAGYSHTIAVKSDRTQFCATGYNVHGQLGDNTTTDKTTFTCNTNTIALPVTIISISANRINAGIQVTWKVADEIGIRYYEIERSIDGSSFGMVGTVTGVGNSSIEHSYNWIDRNVAAGTVFYRIKSTGLSGEVKYSSVVKLTAGNSKQDFAVVPNPAAGGIINLQFRNQPKGKYTIRLINNSGQTAFTMLAFHGGNNSTQVLNPVISLASGTYFTVIRHLIIPGPLSGFL